MRDLGSTGCLGKEMAKVHRPEFQDYPINYHPAL